MKSHHCEHMIYADQRAREAMTAADRYLALGAVEESVAALEEALRYEQNPSNRREIRHQIMLVETYEPGGFPD